QEPARALRIERACAPQRRVGIEKGPRVDVWFPLGDALEAIGEQSFGGDLAGRELARRDSRAQTVEAAHMSGSICNDGVRISRTYENRMLFVGRNSFRHARTIHSSAPAGEP